MAYEVRVSLDPSRGDAFEEWMRGHHVPAVLGSGCFTGAHFERLSAGEYRTRYASATAGDLERYLADHAPGLRADFAARFGGAQVAREVWETREAWGGRAE
ncbi:MAG: DUF4286 family protein [Gemmatimonadales bacterium]